MKQILWILGFLFMGSLVYAQPSGNLGQITPFPNTSGQPYGYNEYLPLNYTTGQTYPLVVNLHGIGEYGPGTLSSLPNLINNSPLKRVKEILDNPNSSTGRHYPAIVVTPQSGSKWFSVTGVKAFIDYLIQVGYPIDQNKIYVMGLSAGGGVTWRFAQEYPDLPAAIVPICGASYVKDPSIYLQEMPIWAFHNFQDNTVGRSFTIKNADYISHTGGPSLNAINYLYPYVSPGSQMAPNHQTFQYDGNNWSIATGVNAPTHKMAITIFSRTGHNCWNATYNTDAMWTWLFAQTKSSNNPVQVNAGADRTVNEAQEPTLSGTATTSSGSIATYQWVQLIGPKGTTMDASNQATTTLRNLSVGTYVFRLSAKNSNNRVSYDDITIQVTSAPTNIAPVAHAGADVTVTLPTNTANLDGSASSDADGTIVSYQWTVLSGPSSTGTAGNPIWINFSADSSRGLAPAPWNNTLNKWRSGDVVNNIIDNQNNSTSISLEMLDTWGGMQPPGPVTGDDSGVFPDVVMSTTQWLQHNPCRILVRGLQANESYDFKFHGGRAGTGNRQTIYSIGNQSGMLNASNNTSQVVDLLGVVANAQGEVLITVAKDSGASYAYLNGMVITPVAGASTPVSIANPNNATTSINNLQEGTYVLELQVTDDQGATHTDQVQVVVQPPVSNNIAPVAHAGADVAITLPTNTANLDGSASSDADGTIVSYQWTVLSGPSSTGTAGNPIWINFSADSSRGLAPAPWNNTLNKWRSGDVVNNIIDNQNNSTSISLEMLDTWGGMQPPGPVTGDDSGVFPDVVMSTTQWLQHNPCRILVRGLQANESYDFKFHGGRAGTGNRQTIYSIGNQSGMLNASNNTSQVVDLLGVVANAQGEVLITVAKDSGASYAYLNGMVITPVSSASTPVSIANPNNVTTSINNLQAGTYVLELQVTDDQGATHTDQVQVVVHPNASKSASGASIEALPIEQSFSIYPNPSSAVINIEGDWTNIEQLEVIDVLGRVQMQLVQPQTTVQLKVEDWETGVYFICLHRKEATPIVYQVLVKK